MRSQKRHLLAVAAALSLLSSATAVSAATYYVRSGGNDSAAGTSDTTAWAHAPGMYGASGTAGSTPLNPGDSVLFKRGDTWTATAVSGGKWLEITNSGSPGHPITFGAYGSGADPKFDLNGLSAYYGGIGLTSVSYVTLEHLDVFDNNNQLIQVWGPGSTGVVIRYCSIHDNLQGGFEGIEVEGMGTLGGVTQITVEHCEFYNIQHDCLKLNDGVTYATISNNTFHDSGHDAIDTLSVQTPSQYCSHFEIYGNDVTRMTDEYGSAGAGTAFYLAGLRDSEIYANTIHDFSGYGIYASEQAFLAQNLLIRNNCLWDLTGSGNYAFKTGPGVTGIKIYNNTIYACNCPDIEYGSYTCANNLAYACTADSGAIKNFGSDPEFVSPTGNPPDFHLQAGSPAIDAGVDVGLPYSGAAPDLGAYEYPAAPSAPTGLRVLP